MITVSAALKAHLASETQTTALLWKVILTNATTLGFTNHDQDIVFGGVTYASATGYSRSDIPTGAALEVDALEVQGFLTSPSITEADLAAGIWDFAAVKISLVNYKDLTMGELIYRVGTLGEVTLERGKFKAELRGKTQAYTRIIGQNTSPSCRTTLGSSLCTVNLTPFTVTSTLTGVGADNRTLYDTARTELGPTGGISITGITRANPGVVTLASAVPWAVGTPVTISGVVGMLQVNTVTTVRNPSGSTFALPVDTSAFSAYVSGGTVTPLGANSGYFDNGVITFTSGLNNGLRMEVASYVPGQIILELPMPYALAIGNTYSMHAGCDYSFATCRDRFTNVANFRGEPYIPGVDKLMQAGKQ